MIESKKQSYRNKKIIIYIVLFFAFILFVSFWPIWRDSPLNASLRIYKDHLIDRQTSLSDIFENKFTIACAIGPYDSFVDARFHGALNEAQRLAADKVLDEININSSGSNNFLLMGFDGDRVANIYLSNFFVNAATGKPGEGFADCISNSGQLKVGRIDRELMAIELREK